jgi:hypothetical protein
MIDKVFEGCEGDLHQYLPVQLCEMLKRKDSSWSIRMYP